ncbi:hypothetical protein P792_00520 [Asaia sp. SF2.1]|nr:hypothetical protein P792_00520 [Asaia sp. SF2.1]
MRWFIHRQAAEIQWLACILLQSALCLKWASDRLNSLALRMMAWADRNAAR